MCRIGWLVSVEGNVFCLVVRPSPGPRDPTLISLPSHISIIFYFLEAHPSFTLAEEILQTFAVESWLCGGLSTFLTLFLKLILLILGSVLNFSNHNSHSASVADWETSFAGQTKVNNSQGCPNDGRVGVKWHNWLNTSNSYANSSCNLLFVQYLTFLLIIITASCFQLRDCFAINFIVQAQVEIKDWVFFEVSSWPLSSSSCSQ